MHFQNPPGILNTIYYKESGNHNTANVKKYNLHKGNKIFLLSHISQQFECTCDNINL